MNIFQSVFLGFVQGITEFLPISSSAHLIIARWIFDWQDPGIAFDVVLHFGTLIGVVWFFFPRWIKTFKSVFSQKSNDEIKFNRKLFLMIVVATVPAGLAGYFFNDIIESNLRSPMIVGWTMIIFGVLLYIGDKISNFKSLPALLRKESRAGLPALLRKESQAGQISNLNINWRQSLTIGFSQTLALIPGVSRSGITMTTGLFGGLDRKTAAEFSFLLAAPIIFGAGAKEIPDLVKSGGLSASLILGFLSAMIFSFLAVKFLIEHLEKGSYKPFAWYRIIVGILIIGVVLL